uniref:Uncharacterized protein n=1 Tax=Leersia perrieri TaxID=77586 RepID=A0A0D9XUQ4_9ORYZ
MAEVAAGAVSSLLGLLRDEARLLGRVGTDVQFIKEEMESMNSFLKHLGKTQPRGASGEKEHDEQVRTWMKQVRELAHDCSNCIDLYIQRSDPALHRAQGGLVWRYVWWLPWFVNKRLAQHKAAVQLGDLKDRARDVGERRLRYGVEVPTKNKASTDDDGLNLSGEMVTSVFVHDSAGPGRLPRALEDRTREEYCREKLNKWLLKQHKTKIVISCVAAEEDFNPAVWIDLPEVHSKFDMPLEPWEILCYILLKLNPNSQPQPAEQATDQHRQDEQDTDDCIKEEDRNEDDDEEEDKNEDEEEDNDEEDDDEEVVVDEEGDNDEEDDDEEVVLDEEEEEEEEEDSIREAWDEKYKVYDEIWEKIVKTNVDAKIKEIKTNIDKEVKSTFDEIQKRLRNQNLTNNVDDDVVSTKLRKLFLALLPPVPNDDVDDKKWAREAQKDLKLHNEKIIKKTAKMLQDHMEAGSQDHTEAASDDKIRLSEEQYVNILRMVFPTSTPLQVQKQDKSATKSTGVTATTLGEDQIKEIVHKAMQDKQLEEHRKLEAADLTGEEINKEIESIQYEIEEQLLIEWIVKKIKEHLNKDKKTLIILQDDKGFLSSWKQTRNGLELLGCDGAGAMVVIITKKSQAAKQFCYPLQEPINYSLVGLYHDSLLQLTRQQANENNNSNSQIFRHILDKCDPDEFCMKMFAHALYAKPSRSNNELCKLHNVLVSQKPVGSTSTYRNNDTTKLVSQASRNNAKKMFKFSYHDLPKEYKSCLLYLAIFSKGDNIKRSNLEERWVVEGLITQEDWPSAMRSAGRCFDELIDRWLVCPSAFDGLGKVKTCVVGDLVHEFITKTAKKQHIVQTRLSHHLAHHFSAFSNLPLRRSDKIDKFMQNLRKFSPYLRMLKVLDLQDCQLFDKNNRYLKNICNRIVLLKYLSIRRTNVTRLPTTINNLQELEVLDIRETKVPQSDTEYVLILKLKRLLAGRVYSSPSSTTGLALRNEKTAPCSVLAPHQIEKMESLEVLSNVSAQNSKNLKDIGKLWQLRKLGVVIDDDKGQLKNLVGAIINLNECLRSLSITLVGTTREQTPPPSEEPPLQHDLSRRLDHTKLLLESLSITGVTHRVHLLPLLAQVSDNLAKLTLSKTSLKQGNLNDIAKLPNLCCFRLRHKAYTDTQITFNDQEFSELKYLIIEDTDITRIRFEEGATPKLENIIMSFTSIQYLDGINYLSNLKELELNGITELEFASFAGARHLSKVTLRSTSLDLRELEKTLAELPSLRSLVLLEKSSCIGNRLNFKESEYAKLNLLVVKCSDITSISFSEKAAPILSKIVWSFTTKQNVHLSGIGNLPELKEIQLTCDHVPNQVIHEINAHKNKNLLTFSKQQEQPEEKEKEAEEKSYGMAWQDHRFWNFYIVESWAWKTRRGMARHERVDAIAACVRCSDKSYAA